MIATCESCKSEFLTEADPYVIRPTPAGSKLYCYCHIKGFDEVKGKIGELEAKLEIIEKFLELIECDCGFFIDGTPGQCPRCKALEKARG